VFFVDKAKVHYTKHILNFMKFLLLEKLKPILSKEKLSGLNENFKSLTIDPERDQLKSS
jgi:hypothetical protein